jgi:hypothetical protein
VYVITTAMKEILNGLVLGFAMASNNTTGIVTNILQAYCNCVNDIVNNVNQTEHLEISLPLKLLVMIDNDDAEKLQLKIMG